MPKLPDRAEGVSPVARRRRAVAPLYAYIRAHGYAVMYVARLAYAAAGQPLPSSGQLYLMQTGVCNAPWWWVRGCCEVMGCTVEQVMGRAWIAEFGVEYGMGHTVAEVERLMATA